MSFIVPVLYFLSGALVTYAYNKVAETKPDLDPVKSEDETKLMIASLHEPVVVKSSDYTATLRRVNPTESFSISKNEILKTRNSLRKINKN